MVKLIFHLLALIMTVQTTIGDTTTPMAEFVKTSCKSTPFPDLCVESLSNVNIKNEQELAQEAVEVSLRNTHIATSELLQGIHFSLTPSQRTACIGFMGSSEKILAGQAQLLKKLGQSKDQNIDFPIINLAQNGLNHSLKLQNACAHSLSQLDGKVNDDTTKRMTRVTQVTSNALALVKGLATPSP